MTIREMEARTGLSRASIRYYEAQGLLHPAREGNGYRNYSEADLQTLEKVRLLRSLDLPIEEVLAIQSGNTALSQSLRAHLEELERRREQMERTLTVTNAMLADGVSYDDLEPEGYLRALDQTTAEPPRLDLPWRRYLARELDCAICGAAACFVPLIGEELEFLVGLILLFLTEPMCLSLFGTTPGKAIFGIRVTDRTGGRLSYLAALDRTWLTMWEGMLLRIPLLSLYALVKSWLRNQEGEPLVWEEHSEVAILDDRRWRYALYIPAAAAVTAAAVIGTLWKGGFYG